MRWGKGLSTLKNCTLGEGKHNKEMEANNALRKRYIRQETWKTIEEKEKIQKKK
tara:strand:+ start:425 stop:586 length:162 start_codon:yes stop_codon:yes gene_type:complete